MMGEESDFFTSSEISSQIPTSLMLKPVVSNIWALKKKKNELLTLSYELFAIQPKSENPFNDCVI